MDGLGGISNPLALIYLVGAGAIVYQLARNWKLFWDDHITGSDSQLAGGVAFFLLVPVGVLLHELGHIAAASATGSHVLGLSYFLYWGYVTYIPATSEPLLLWLVSLSGNAVSYLVGALCLFAALRLRGLKPILRLVFLQLGLLEMAQTLIFYPLLSLDPAFDGDWDTIYSFDAPLASAATLLLHAVSLVALVLLIRRNRTSRALLGAS